MNNKEFKTALREAFLLGIENPRGTSKLRKLHGAIAEDLQNRLNEFSEEFVVYSQGMSGDQNKEIKVEGHYYNKDVDITVMRGDKVIAGFEVKLPQSSFNKNSNNMFENLLGNTANIRLKNNQEYFLILCIPSKVPVYTNAEKLEDKKIKNIESISKHQLSKYGILSSDDPLKFFHTPSKSLVYYFDLPEIPSNVLTYSEYAAVVKAGDITENETYKDMFEDNTILNNYDEFIKKVVFLILSK